MTGTRTALAALVALAGALLPAGASAARATQLANATEPLTQLVSVNSHGVRGDRGSASPAVSSDGRFVAFSSSASNLVATDTNRSRDVFVRDRRSGTTRRVSIGSGGSQGNGDSYGPSISGDGRFIAFTSRATNLASGDADRDPDVFVHDLATRKTAIVSVGPGGRRGNGGSYAPSISANGWFVAFTSRATNLTKKADTNRRRDIFVRDRADSTTSRVSVSWRQRQANGNSWAAAISASGRFVAFTSGATNLAKASDTNRRSDVFVRDRSSRTTARVSVTWRGAEANGESRQAAISMDGRVVAFTSRATNLVKKADTNRKSDVFVRDRAARTTSRVSVTTKERQANDGSGRPRMSGDGSVISFGSKASNLVRRAKDDNHTDVFARDRAGKKTFLVSVSRDGEQANGASRNSAISADGRFVAFSSNASNLVGKDNRHSQIFARGPLPAAAGDPVIAAAGDIACDPEHPHYNGGNGTAEKCRHKYTSNLLVNRGLAKVLTLGDNQYENGALSKFRKSYDPTWGRVKSITRPSLGNHEYLLPGASGYFDYFGSAAGPRGKGYYSFNVGSWHIIALNSNCKVVSCAAGSAQEKWLRQDLANHKTKCTLAYWHHARFSSSFGGNNTAVLPFWQALYDAGADVVLSAHSHVYERFAPQSPSGKLDTARGIRQFIVGTGGASHAKFGTPQPNSQVRNATAFGVLRLTLHSGSYDWKFVPEAGKSFTDSGTGACH